MVNCFPSGVVENSLAPFSKNDLSSLHFAS